MSTSATPAEPTASSTESVSAPDHPSVQSATAEISDDARVVPTSAEAKAAPAQNEAAPETAAQSTGEPSSTEPVTSQDRPTAEPTSRDDPDATSAPTEVPAASKPATESAKPKPMTLDDVASVPTLLRFLAQHKTTPKGHALKKGSDAREAFTRPIDLDQYDDEIRSYAAEDLRLNTPASLVLTVEKSDLTGGARENFLTLAMRLTTAHPAFQDDEIIDTLGRAIAAEQSREPAAPLIAALTKRASDSFERADELKTPERQALVDNAATFAILLAAMAEKWGVADLVDAFADNVWLVGQPKSFVAGQAREAFASLSKSVRPPLAMVVTALRNEDGRLRADLHEANERAERLLARSDQLAESAAEARREQESAVAELQRLRADIQRDAEVQRRDRMRAASDYEALRVSMSQLVSAEIESLEDAHDALNRGRTHITDEFIGRTIASLRKGLDQLQPNNRDNSQGDSR